MSAVAATPERQRLLTRAEAAEYLGVKTQTLAAWATTKRYDLPYVRVGTLAKYRIDDLDRFIASNVVTNEA